jgi:hypothetical protein
MRSIRIPSWRKLIPEAGLELRVVPSALLLILGGDIPGLVAVTPASAAAAKSACAMTDLRSPGDGISLGFGTNASGEVVGRSYLDKVFQSARSPDSRRTERPAAGSRNCSHHLAERTDTGGGPP